MENNDNIVYIFGMLRGGKKNRQKNVQNFLDYKIIVPIQYCNNNTNNNTNNIYDNDLYVYKFLQPQSTVKKKKKI